MWGEFLRGGADWVVYFHSVVGTLALLDVR